MIHRLKNWKTWLLLVLLQPLSASPLIPTAILADPPPYLSPQEAAEKMTLRDGFEVTVFASEPAISQPMAFCFDDRGRLWVAENQDYLHRGAHSTTGKGSRILILEDTDGDGKADRSKVFLEGLPFPSAIAWGFDGLWLGAPPNLLFVPDLDGDDRADRDNIEVRLTGWGIRDRHETLNSFIWGPDGWLYGCQGFATPSKVGRPERESGKAPLYVWPREGTPPKKMRPINPVTFDGAIWRYHPVKDRFEVFAEGFSNPWGLDFDDQGEAFISACVIPHLWHVVQGGFFQRQGGPRYSSPYVYEWITTIRDHAHASAHGGARFYLANAFPPEYRGRLFMCNIHQHAILTDTLERRGSGFVGHHGDDFLLANDPQWVGFSVEVGPEGAVYALDWHDRDICGKAIHHKKTGRVFRITARGTPPAGPLNLRALPDAELVRLQLHPNDWYVRQARVLLQSRAAGGRLQGETHEALWRLFRDQSETRRKLRALWCLHGTGGLRADRMSRSDTGGGSGDPPSLIQLLHHPDEYIRAWAIRFLCEDGDPPPEALKKFAHLARKDPSPIVRLFLASAIRRIPVNQRWEIAGGLVSHGEDGDDHNLPKMYWYALEPLVGRDPERALRLATEACKIPLLTRFIARRLAGGSTVVRSRQSPVDEAIDCLSTLSRVAPGFYVMAWGEGGVGWEENFRGRGAVRTHPVSREVPCVLERTLQIPAGKKTRLLIQASHHPHGDWQLVVRANGRVLRDFIVGPETVSPEWVTLELDLTRFAGKSLRLELENRANDWMNEFAYWGNIDVVSR